MTPSEKYVWHPDVLHSSRLKLNLPSAGITPFLHSPFSLTVRMRQSLVLVWLTAVLSVFALNDAAPFEILWYYTAYKIEWRSGISPRNIATGCRHAPSAAFDAAASAAGVSGICTFDEFVRHFDSRDVLENFATGQPLDPSDQEVRQSWTDYLDTHGNPRFQGSLSRIIPATDPAVTGRPQVGLAPILREVLGYVQDARDYAGDDHLIDGWLRKSISYLKAASQIRTADQAKHLKNWFQEIFEDPIHWTRDPAYIITEPILYEDGTPSGLSSGKYNFELVNSKANTVDLTVNDYKDAMLAIRSKKPFKRTKPPQGATNHLIIIDMFLSSSNLIQLPSPSECSVFTR